MNQAEFEGLTAQVLAMLPRIRDSRSLVRFATHLLDGELALLVERRPPNGDPALIAVAPPTQHAWAAARLNELRWWDTQAELGPAIDGGMREHPLEIDGRVFNDTLVAFGGILPRQEPPRYELIVLASPERKYTTYHCAMAAAMVRHYEHRTAIRQLAAAERRAKKAYAGVVTLEVLDTESWDSFVERVEEGAPKRAEHVSFMGPAAVIWTGYRVRRSGLGPGEAARSPQDPPSSQSRSGLPGGSGQEGDRGEQDAGSSSAARDWFAKAFAEADASKAKKRYEALLVFLLENRFLDEQLAEEVHASLSLGSTGSKGARTPSRDRRFGDGRARDDPGGDDRGGNGRDRGDHGDGGHGDGGRARDDRAGGDHAFCDRQAALMVLEHAWRLVYRAATFGPRPPESLPKSKQCSELLRLTRTLAVEEITREVSGCDMGARSETPRARLDRETLRLYLATLLCDADRLRERCLGIPRREGDEIYREAPAEVRREVLLFLSRFMLGVVQILFSRNQLETKTRAVSRVEVLDGLLYVVDRYVHVQLEVDERLHIRDHLGRALTAELHHHINRRHYRDHLLHVIDVFLLGHLLLDTRMRWVGDQEASLVEHIAKIVGAKETGEAPLGILPEDWLRNWAVASLLHDLSYQLVSASKPLDDPENASRFFHLPRAARPDWLSTKRPGNVPMREILTQMIDGLASNGGCPWLPQAETFDLEDHGILGALRVGQVLAHADTEGSPRSDAPELRLVGAYRSALHAIAHHNLPNHEVRFSTHPLSCLLRLCDELQEWGRRRVNIEQMVKRLYLKIEEDEEEGLEGFESLACLDANLVFGKRENGHLTVRLDGNPPHMEFRLIYRDPVKAQYDAVSTLLGKAYSLQHVDLSTNNMQECSSMEWRILLHFPHPREYRGLTEVDLYGLLRERVRVLPELWRFQHGANAEPGLVWLTGEPGRSDPADTDCLAIIVREQGTREWRYGWQTCDPSEIRSELIELKRQLLAGRVLGPEQGWLFS